MQLAIPQTHLLFQQFNNLVQQSLDGTDPETPFFQSLTTLQPPSNLLSSNDFQDQPTSFLVVSSLLLTNDELPDFSELSSQGGGPCSLSGQPEFADLLHLSGLLFGL